MGIPSSFHTIVTATIHCRVNTMPLDKIKPNDPRVQSQFAQLNGRRWHYLDAHPSGEVKGTCVLVHGFPDLSLAWKYQWGSPDHPVEKCLGQDEGRIRKFLNGAYGGKAQSGKPFMSPQEGVDLSLVEKEEFGKTPLLDDEDMDFYVQQFTKTGFEGPCNWYRTRRLNWEQDQNIPAATQNHLPQPVLFIQAKYDGILIPKLSQGMEKAIPNLTRAEVPASHWALWHTPEQTNDTIQKWIEGVVLGGKSKLRLAFTFVRSITIKLPGRAG